MYGSGMQGCRIISTHMRLRRTQCVILYLRQDREVFYSHGY